jgi:hypothetical protein
VQLTEQQIKALKKPATCKVARRASRLHFYSRPPPASRSGPPGRSAGRAAGNSSLSDRPQGGSSKNCGEDEATSGPVLAALIFYFVSRCARLVPFVSRQKGRTRNMRLPTYFLTPAPSTQSVTHFDRRRRHAPRDGRPAKSRGAPRDSTSIHAPQRPREAVRPDRAQDERPAILRCLTDRREGVRRIAARTKRRQDRFSQP